MDTSDRSIMESSVVGCYGSMIKYLTAQVLESTNRNRYLPLKGEYQHFSIVDIVEGTTRVE